MMMPPPPFPPSFARRPPREAENPKPRPTSPPRGSPGDILLHAAFEGNLRVVKKMVKALDEGDGRLTEKVAAVRDSNGLGPLHLAAGRARMPVCRYLVEELRLDVNAADCNKDILSAKATCCQDLMEIVMHTKKAWGVYMPLVTAVYAGSLSCVKLLIEAGADVQGVVKETPLMVAAANGLTDILKCLVQAGADPNVHDCLGQTPVEIAARFGSRKDVKVLFPVTSRIPAVRHWSVDGIISYANSRPPVKNKDVRSAMLAGGKFQGREAVKNKDYLAAAYIYTEAMDLDPGDATLYANRSFCWFHLGEGKKALMDAQTCRAMRPSWSKACYREGAALMLLKDYEKACDAFLDALKLEPGNVETKSALREAESLKISRSAAKE
ncbi:hypothetical protein EJB05_21637 [Eragrostis curvula]|uniref:Uncharacterized protein n=1 Tax=Eragrostis curvula TaxID=38414 RepID=A0A5J9V2B4_9POAL|nr:hypothetical protein EJB05_21637 [Eragrostis curvula]